VNFGTTKLDGDLGVGWKFSGVLERPTKRRKSMRNLQKLWHKKHANKNEFVCKLMSET
jgi:hypothetical protein